MKHVLIAALCAGLAASASTAWAQDVAAGETSFKKCALCHKIGPGATKMIGPELNGLDGRKAGTTDYNYSAANKSSGIVWNEQTFKQYIKSPRAMIPKTNMSFPGISNAREIDNLWAYIRQFKADGSK